MPASRSVVSVLLRSWETFLYPSRPALRAAHERSGKGRRSVLTSSMGHDRLVIDGRSRKENAMAKVIECQDGFLLRGASDDDLVANAEAPPSRRAPGAGRPGLPRPGLGDGQGGVAMTQT
jgi:hypothetical protein